MTLTDPDGPPRIMDLGLPAVVVTGVLSPAMIGEYARALAAALGPALPVVAQPGLVAEDPGADAWMRTGWPLLLVAAPVARTSLMLANVESRSLAERAGDRPGKVVVGPVQIDAALTDPTPTGLFGVPSLPDAYQALHGTVTVPDDLVDQVRTIVTVLAQTGAGGSAPVIDGTVLASHTTPAGPGALTWDTPSPAPEPELDGQETLFDL